MIFQLLTVLLPAASSLLAIGLALFVLSRNWRAWANRWLAFGLAVIGLHQTLMLASVTVASGQLRLTLVRLSLATAAMIAPSWLSFALKFGEANGGSRLTRWRPALFWLIGTIPSACIGLALGWIVKPVRLGTTGVILVGLDGWGKAYFSVFLVGLAMVLLHLENLYRSAARLTRWKIKFLVVGVFLAFASQIVIVSYAILYGFIHPLSPFFGALGYLLGQCMIAFALVRHRLFDVDIFVSRYVVYRSLTLALVGSYLLSLGLVAELFRQLNMPLDLLSGTFLAILGGAVLSLLLLSENIRRRVQRSIHTHFYKHKYDYRVEWMEYTRRLSRATAIPEIAVQTVNRLMEVMWVRQAAMYTFGDSPGRMTLAHHVEYDALPAALDLPPQAVEALRESARLIPATEAKDDPPDIALAGAQGVLGEVPVGCLVPIVALDTLVGLLAVGPEVSGKPFGVDDRDLLAAVAAQAGALLLNARLSKEASEGRELQLLARLSAFVAHDLKNMVSMLSLLVDNAKVHIAKPEFQADAIRTLTDVASKMRTLLTALTSPSSRTEVRVKPVDLASIVEVWMREIHARVPSRIRLETRLGWTAEVRVDAEQLRSVLENLVLNSIEATTGEGAIVVETSQENGHAVFMVTDTGRGMTQEFIQRRLFRPFQTTKSRGLGIGLYQCRHIIQSFGGTLTAKSQEGMGTCMMIRLPVDPISKPETIGALGRGTATEYASAGRNG